MTTSTRRIDHLVLAVHDLDAAAAFYERLGFQVGARNRHPWGTENRLVQLRSSFLELITVAAGVSVPAHGPQFFSFGAFVRDHLDEREGFAMLALDSAGAVIDAADVARAGIGDHAPFSFERDGRRPDGTTTRVGFTLAFARDPQLPGSVFFVCQQHAPDAFWNPAFQQHPNGAVDVAAVVVTVPDPGRHTSFLTSFTGAEASEDQRRVRFANGGELAVEAGRGAVGLTAFTVGVPTLESVTGRLEREGVPCTIQADRVEIASADAFGVTIRFERMQPSPSVGDHDLAAGDRHR